MSYPDDWDARASEVRERDDYTCQNCQRQGGPYGELQLDCHHIVPVSAGGSHRYSNLTTLCVDCHKAVHNEGIVAPTVDEDGVYTGPSVSEVAGDVKTAVDLFRGFL